MKLMKRLSLVIAIISTVMVTPIDSYAGFWDGTALIKKFYEYEKNDRNDPRSDNVEVGLYMGYVIGVCDSLDLLLAIPENLQARQVCSIVGKYLKDNPEKWNLPANQLVFEALKKAFPKKK